MTAADKGDGNLKWTWFLTPLSPCVRRVLLLVAFYSSSIVGHSAVAADGWPDPPAAEDYTPGALAAYQQALTTSGGTRLIDITINERWFWAYILNGYSFEVTGTAVRPKKG